MSANVLGAAMADVDISNEFYWDSVIGAMHDVMQGARGTARAVGMGAPYQMAGKSGTAQVVSIAQDAEYDEDEIEERMRDHALFIAFAPLDNPRIAVALIVDNQSAALEAQFRKIVPVEAGGAQPVDPGQQ